MAEKDKIQVLISYKYHGDDNWITTKFTQEEYFDFDDEPFDLDSVPKFNHAIEYLKIDKSVLQNTKILLEDTTSQNRRTITETFWNKAQNRIIERTDTGTSTEYWEIIQEILINTKPSTWEIIRFGKERDIIKLWSHVVITDNPDGSQTETKIFPEE